MPMKIIEMASKNFWKGEVGINGIVEEQEKRYQIMLEVKGNQVYGYSCSCTAGNSPRGMCRHAAYMLECYRKSGGGETAAVSTSSQARAMIREYTNREVSQLTLEEEQETVQLIPKIVAVKDQLDLELSLYSGKSYVIRDLFGFAQAMSQGAYVEYGKKLAFHHQLSSFTSTSRPLVVFILEVVNGYREAMEQFRKNSYGAIPSLRTLHLSRSKRDVFFQLVKNQTILWQNQKNDLEELTTVDGTPALKINIKKLGQDGISVKLDQSFYNFQGDQYLYLKNGGMLYRCEQNAGNELKTFLDQMPAEQLQIQNRDMPLFYERVLKKILPYVELESDGVKLEQFEPEKLRADFYFDSSSSDQISMRPQLTYGDYSFHPVEDVRVPRTICRDVPREFKISQLITKYFKYKEYDNHDLVIQDDQQALYLLLTEGMAEFRSLGEVHFSETFQRLKVVAAPVIRIGVQSFQSWLKISIDIEDIEKEELARLLMKYQQKAKFHRMKNGEFLNLDEDGMINILKLIDQCGIQPDQLARGEVKLPAYRSLLVDSMQKTQTGIIFERDQVFKAMIREMKSVEESDIAVPHCLEAVLRHYQAVGYRWMRTLDTYGFGGILADDMGLGKTIQMIALLQSGAETGPAGVSLVVCPASLVYNWEHEFSLFAPALKVAVVSGSAGERQKQIDNARFFDVLVTSYDLLKRDLEWYQSIEFRYQIIDEAQAIKNPLTQNAKAVKLIRAKCKFASTGTPLENRLGDLWSIFDYLMPGFLYSYQLFKKKIETPIMKDGEQELLHQFHQMVNPFILRRLKKDVLTELPDKVETVMYAKMEHEQQQLYTAAAYQLKELLDRQGDAVYRQEKLKVLAEITRLRQLCCDPSLCYTNYQGGSAKLESCLDLILTGVEGGHKILLFSQFTAMLEIIEKRVKTASISYYKLTGSTAKEKRMEMVQHFQKDQTSLFLISLKAGGTGLNLTAADMVIHYEPWWNVAVQNQATDRAHRIGQKNRVSVFQMITKNTIEEQIVRLQQQKKELADQIITEGTFSLGGITREDLLLLLEQQGIT